MHKIILYSAVFSCVFIILTCFISAVEADYPSHAIPSKEFFSYSSLSGETEVPASNMAESPPVKPVIENSEITSDVFGKRSGLLRPFISLTGYYTDNLFKTRDNKHSDFVTVLSPGILISFPGLKEIALTETSVISPGGFPAGRFIKRYPGRLQSYLFYAADFEFYSKHSSDNFVSHRAEGMLQYNFRGGISIDMLNQLVKSHDDWGMGEFFTRDEYFSNLFSLALSYEISDKTLLRFDYSNYNLDFKDAENSFRDRKDNYMSGYLFYKIRPRLALFGQYEFIDISYKEDILSNSKEHNVYCGARWNISKKTTGYVKAGYSLREFDLPEMKNEKGYLFEAQVDYRFTPKTSLRLSASRKNNETDISRADYIVSDNIRASYAQKLTSKITANINISYTDDRYKGTVTIDGISKKLQDIYHKGGISLDYAMRERLKMRLGYDYSKRNSNFDIFDYTANILFMKISFSM